MKPRNEMIIELDRSKAGQQLPDITLPISDKFYIKKLQVSNATEALLADELWIHHNHKDGLTPIQPAHALTKENGAYYVLYEKHAGLSLDTADKVYAYAYVSKASSDVLVFEHAELYSDSESDDSIVCGAYIRLANRLIERSDIATIHCGVSTTRDSIVIGRYDVTLPSSCSSQYKNIWGRYPGFLADKNLFVSLNESRDLLLDKDAFDAELERCAESKSVTSKMRANIRWIFSNDHEKLLPRPVSSRLVESYIAVQEKFKKTLREYADTQKIFELPPLSDDVDLNMLISKATEGDKNSATATMLAASFGHAKFLSKLIARNNNVNLENEHFRDALFYASLDKYVSMKTSAEVRDYDSCIKILLDAKADIHHADYVGNTPILLATVNNNLNRIGRLLEAKANISGLSGDFQTPLMNAVWNYTIGNHSTSELLKYLIKSKADVNMQADNGDTALMQAVKLYRDRFKPKDGERSREVVSLLVEAKADVTIKNHIQKTALSLEKECLSKYKNSKPLFQPVRSSVETQSQADALLETGVKSLSLKKME